MPLTLAMGATGGDGIKQNPGISGDAAHLGDPDRVWSRSERFIERLPELGPVPVLGQVAINLDEVS
jgi:hypothetical protein